MKIRSIAYAVALLLPLGAVSLMAEEITSKDAIGIIEGIGELELKQSQVGDGSIAEFRSFKSTCTGTCGGSPVPPWSCSGSKPYCALDCTQSPPRRYCVDWTGN